jgi:hypothetical protein
MNGGEWCHFFAQPQPQPPSQLSYSHSGALTAAHAHRGARTYRKRYQSPCVLERKLARKRL